MIESTSMKKSQILQDYNRLKGNFDDQAILRTMPSGTTCDTREDSLTKKRILFFFGCPSTGENYAY